MNGYLPYIISLLSIVISLFSLILGPKLNLKAKRLEKQLNLRLDLLIKIQKLKSNFEKDLKKSNSINFIKYLDTFIDLTIDIEICGKINEIKLFENFKDSITNLHQSQMYNKIIHIEDISKQQLIDNYNLFFSEVNASLRKELKID